MKKILLLFLSVFLILAPIEAQGIRAGSAYTNNATTPPPPSYPSALDTHTVLWVCSDSTDYIVKDGGNLVADWQDILLSGHDLEQATGSRKPLWTTDGVVFDASTSTDHMKTATFTLVQPTFIYMVVKNVTWISSGYWFDGFTADGGYVYNSGTTPSNRVSAGSPSDVFSVSVGTVHIIRVLFNGASSKIIVDNDTPITGNWGTGTMDGLTLGNASGFYAPGAVTYQEIIVRNISDSSGDEADIYTYLKDKYGL
jgi:hypothetical protein